MTTPYKNKTSETVDVPALVEELRDVSTGLTELQSNVTVAVNEQTDSLSTFKEDVTCDINELRNILTELIDNLTVLTVEEEKE